MEFANYIKDLRKAKGLSARELSRRSGVSQPYLSQLETGKHKQPTRKALEKLAKGLEADYDELLLRAGYVSGKAELARKANEAISNSPAIKDSLEKMERDWKEKNNFVELAEVFSEKTTLAINGQLLTKNGKLLSNEDKEKILEMIKLHLS